MIEIKDNLKRDATYNLQEIFQLGSIKKVVHYANTIRFVTTDGYYIEMDEYEAKRIGLAVLGKE